MNYNIYRISRDKWNKIVNNHSRQHHNPTSGNQIYMGRKARWRESIESNYGENSPKRKRETQWKQTKHIYRYPVCCLQGLNWGSNVGD